MLSNQGDHHAAPSPGVPDQTRPFTPHKSQEEERLRLFQELCESREELEAQYDTLRLNREEGAPVHERTLDLFELAPIGYCVISEQGMLLKANQRAFSLLDLGVRHWFKQPFAGLIHPDDHGLFCQSMGRLFGQKLMDSEEPPRTPVLSLRMTRLDDNWFWARAEGVLAMDQPPGLSADMREAASTASDGEAVCLLAFGDDTEPREADTANREQEARKRVRAALMESEARYRSYFNAAGDMIFLKDADFRYLLVNAGLAAFWGRNREDVVGMNDFELMPREVALRCRKSDLQVRNASTVVVNDEIVGDRVYETRKFAVPLGQGGTGVGGFVRDVTAERETRTRLHETLAMTNKLAVDAVVANKAKSTFLANISHELRTPLNAILGFAHILNRDPALTPSQADHLRTILRCGDHLLTLINTILDMARLESGQVRVRETDFDLIAFLNGLARNSRPNILPRDLTFILDMEPDLPRTVQGDMAKTRRILENLLSNAFKYTTRGSITLWVQRISGPGNLGAGDSAPPERVSEPPEPVQPAILPPLLWVRFEVRDTGPGIPVEDRTRIFESFHQGVGDTHAGGTGLGLTISRDLARLMGGDLTLADQEEPGSSFRLEIPLRAPQTDDSRCGVGPCGVSQESDDGPDGVRQAEDQDGFQARDVGSAQDDPTALDLTSLPPLAVQRMHQALLQGDMTTLHAVLLEAEAHDPFTVQGLTRIAHRYDYDLLGKLFSTTPPPFAPKDQANGEPPVS